MSRASPDQLVDGEFRIQALNFKDLFLHILQIVKFSEFSFNSIAEVKMPQDAHVNARYETH